MFNWFKQIVWSVLKFQALFILLYWHRPPELVLGLSPGTQGWSLIYILLKTSLNENRWRSDFARFLHATVCVHMLAFANRWTFVHSNPGQQWCCKNKKDLPRGFFLKKNIVYLFTLQQSVHRQMLLSSRAAKVDPHRGSFVVINEELMRVNQWCSLNRNQRCT